MNESTQLRPGAVYRGARPIRDYKYRQFVKKFPCAGCAKTWWIDPAHTGPHGTGQKACDRSCIPLCRMCHVEFDADPSRFAEKHGLDIPALITMFNHFYDLHQGRAA